MSRVHVGGRWRRYLDRGAAATVAGSYFGAMLLWYPFHGVFELDTDEGINAIKALLLGHGYALYRQVWNDQPPLFSYLLWGWFTTFGWDIDRGRVLVLIFAALIVFAIYDSLRVTWGHLAAVAAIAVLVCSPHFMRVSVSVLIGLPSLTGATLCAWALIRWARHGRRGWLVAAAAFMGLSLAMKLFTLFLLPVFGLWIVLITYRRAGAGHPQLQVLYPATLWGVCSALVAAAPFLALTGVPGFDQLFSAHARASAALGNFQTVHWAAGIGDNYPAALVATVGAALIILRRKWDLAILLFWSAAALAALSIYQPIWYHHRLLLIIPAAPIGGIAVAELVAYGWRHYRSLRIGRWALVPAAAAILVLVMFSGSYHDHPSEYHMLEEHSYFTLAVMKAYRNQTTTVVADRLMYAFRAGYEVPPNLAVISTKRFAAGALSADQILKTIGERNPEQILLSSKFPDPVTRRIEATVSDRYRLVYSDSVPIPTKLYVRSDVAGDPLQALLQAVKHVPNVSHAYDAIGTQWAARGEGAKAVAAFQHAVELNPANAQARQHLAEASIAAGQAPPRVRQLVREVNQP